MLIKRITLLLMIIFVLNLSTPTLAAEAGNGIIEGRVVNGTADGSSVADQDVTLKTYQDDAEVDSATTRADTEGRFAFDGLSTSSGYSYQVTLIFQEAEYYSEWLDFAEGETRKVTEVTVYDSTTSDEAIRVAIAHTIVYVRQGNLEVVEFYLFTNESDRTYIGSGEITATGKRRTLSLQLPDKMTEPQYGGELMTCCVLPGEGGFFDTMPVLPGSKEVAYSYKVDYKSGAYALSQRVNYPINDFNILVQGESVIVTSDQLVPRGLVEFEGSQFNQLSGSDFAKGDTLLAQLSGLPQTSNQRIVLWVVLTLIVLGAGFGFVYLTRRGRLQPVRATGSVQQSRQELLVELAQLDNDFEDSKIPEGSYRRLRAEKKAQLVTLMQRPKKNSGKG